MSNLLRKLKINEIVSVDFDTNETETIFNIKLYISGLKKIETTDSIQYKSCYIDFIYDKINNELDHIPASPYRVDDLNDYLGSLKFIFADHFNIKILVLKYHFNGKIIKV